MNIKTGVIDFDPALIYATAAYTAAGCKRRFTGDDYIVHPMEVVRILHEVGITDIDVSSAALLHDVIEDTQCTKEDLLIFFSEGIVDMVVQLTDVPLSDGNRETRKVVDRLRLKLASSEVQSIKCADLISNLTSIKEHDPSFYQNKFRGEAIRLLEVLTKAHPELRKRVSDLLEVTP